MYSWGGSSSNFSRGGYNFDPARSAYLDNLAQASAKQGPRAYSRPAGPNMDLVDPRGKNISSDSKNPLIVAVDVTGSMASWPAEIFDRLPLLYQTLSQYREDVEISFCAIGDANSDSYPLQVNDFGKGLKLEETIKALYPEGGGGGQAHESYELFGYFMQEHAKTPNATAPFLMIFGDENFYKQIRPEQVQHYIGDKMSSPADSNAMLKGLAQRFNTYYLHKPYDNGSLDEQIVKDWSAAIGPERVVALPSADRAVDIAMGIIAKHWGQYDDFGKNLAGRQNSSAQKTVHYALRHIPDAATYKSGASRLALPSDGKTWTLKAMLGPGEAEDK